MTHNISTTGISIIRCSTSLHSLPHCQNIWFICSCRKAVIIRYSNSALLCSCSLREYTHIQTSSTQTTIRVQRRPAVCAPDQARGVALLGRSACCRRNPVQARCQSRRSPRHQPNDRHDRTRSTPANSAELFKSCDVNVSR